MLAEETNHDLPHLNTPFGTRCAKRRTGLVIACFILGEPPNSKNNLCNR